jgi:hypothetical protein
MELMSTLKWKNSAEGYSKNTPAGSSMTTPASQITSQERCLLLNFPRGAKKELALKAGKTHPTHILHRRQWPGF